MLEIIEHILRQFEENKSNEQSDKYNCIIMCKNYIDNNFLSVITLDSLSSLFYINKYTLMRRFKKMYHENIMAYYRKLRIEYSKNTLQKTNLSVLAISEKMNFNDIYSFSRFFKNNVGCSPVTYRKNLNEKIEE